MQYIHVDPDKSVSGQYMPAAAKDYVRQRIYGGQLQAIARLLAAWRAAGALVVHIVFNHVTPDGTDLEPGIFQEFTSKNPDPSTWAIRTAADPLSAVLSGIEPGPGEIVLQKTTYSAFQSTNLNFVLRNHRIDRVITVGGLTCCCVQHTATDAKALGYRIFTVPDADSDRSEEQHQRALQVPGYEAMLTVEQALAMVRE